MASIVQGKVLIMFIMLLIGVLCSKIGMIDEMTNKKLSNLSLMLVSPMLIFSTYQTDFSTEMLKNLGIVLLLSVICFVVEIVFSYIMIPAKGNKAANVERICMIYSNCGFMGIPLIQALYGSEGVFYLTVYITVFNILLWTQGVILMTGAIGNPRQMLKNLCTPSIFAIFGGLLCFLLRIRLPEVILDPIESIGSMNTPLAMLVAGSSLGNSKLLPMLKNKRLYWLSIIKLLIIPAIAALALWKFPFAPMLVMLPILSTACPTGASGTMFALRYNGDSILASQIFAVTTLLSILSIPVIVNFCTLLGII